jgi:hypothetical protein
MPLVRVKCLGNDKRRQSNPFHTWGIPELQIPVDSLSSALEPAKRSPKDCSSPSFWLEKSLAWLQTQWLSKWIN